MLNIELERWVLVSGVVTDGSGAGIGGIGIEAYGTIKGSSSPIGRSVSIYELASPLGGGRLVGDDIESWNRWYDLEHLPPTVQPGRKLSRWEAGPCVPRYRT